MADLAVRFFDNRCFVTHEKFKKRGFVIHHLEYITRDVKRQNYPKGEKGRQQYLVDLEKTVKNYIKKEQEEYRKEMLKIKEEFDNEFEKILDYPTRFMLIKNGIHTRIDHPRRGLSRMKRENFIRLCMAVLMTKKERKRTV